MGESKNSLSDEKLKFVSGGKVEHDVEKKFYRIYDDDTGEQIMAISDSRNGLDTIKGATFLDKYLNTYKDALR